jgi:hypothetical protein
MVITACAPPQTYPGRGPSGLRLGTNPSPVGGHVIWSPPTGAVGYVVERGVAGSGTRSRIANSCTDPAFFNTRQDANGNPEVHFTDRTGGVAERATYTYVVHAFTASGQTGWNSIQWTAPTVPSTSVSFQVQGSTVKLTWSVPSADPLTNLRIVAPQDFLITSSYGLSLVKSRGSFTGCGCYVDILGVPIGTHSFTIATRWPPDVSKSRTLNITVVP